MVLEALLWPGEEAVAVGTGVLGLLEACRKSPTRCQLINVALSLAKVSSVGSEVLLHGVGRDQA